jgi:hypothetical protein
VDIADSEWNLIWPTTLSKHPDFVLSLGTGHDPLRKERATNTGSRKGILRNGKFLLKIATDHIQDALDCEKTWREYVRGLPDDLSRSRFVRYNIEMAKSLPDLDDVQRLDAVQERAKERLAEVPGYFQCLAMQLMATSFYFETEKTQQLMQNAATIRGKELTSTFEPSV